jgi:HD-GYP domain-containing protein (c-di-GMP phosphodiesterase class II)/HAMP domain-containing protein
MIKKKGASKILQFRFQLSLIMLIFVILILSSFLSLMTVLSISRRVSNKKAEQLFGETGFRIEELLNGQFEQALRLSRMIPSLSAVSVPVAGDGTGHPLLLFMAEVLNAYPNLYSLYIGFPDRDFLQLIHAAENRRILDSHAAPDGTEFILRAITLSGTASPQEGSRSPDRVERWSFLDADMRILSKRDERSPSYDPTSRVWYTTALSGGNQPVLTDPYIYGSLKAPGLTAACHAANGVVFGVDIALTNIEVFLNSIHASERTGILVLDDEDRILASSAVMKDLAARDIIPLSPFSELESSPLSFLFDARQAEGRVSVNGRHLVWKRVWNTPGSRRYQLIIAAPAADFLDHFPLLQKRVVGVSVLLLLLVMPLVFIVSRSMSRFLEVLAADARRIQNFDFAGRIPDSSPIIEFEELARAFLLMKETLSARTRALEVSGQKLERIIQLGIAMSAESDTERLLELILQGAKEISHADGGSLYLKEESESLAFRIVINESLGIYQGGLSGHPIVMPSVPLSRGGKPNMNNVVSYAYHTRKTVSIDDAYQEPNFDFSGTREFDEMNGYRSRSFLTVPLSLQGGRIIGALQLINSVSPDTGEIIPFSTDIQSFVEALSAEAAAVLNNKSLMEAQRRLFESLIHLIAGAIDTKSPYTGGHCARVPELAMMLADAAEKTETGPLASFRFADSDDRHAFRIAAWLHDSGKVTTPEFVVDKAVKLETITNRIHEIRTRFEVVLRDIRLAEKDALLAGSDPGEAAKLREAEEASLMEDFRFVAECNDGACVTDEARTARLKAIAARTWYRYFRKDLGLSLQEQERYISCGTESGPGWEPLLADKPEHIIPNPAVRHSMYERYGFKLPHPGCLYNHGEIYNLSIRQGTLTTEERYKINEHIMQTIVMLDQLSFPETLARVPEYAGTHHETLTGSGYPCGIDAGGLSYPSRIMAIADIFEALTASDRPYKRAKPLSEAVSILHGMKQAGLIDADLFRLFLSSGVYKRYADRFLSREQLDDFDVGTYLD